MQILHQKKPYTKNPQSFEPIIKNQFDAKRKNSPKIKELLPDKIDNTTYFRLHFTQEGSLNNIRLPYRDGIGYQDFSCPQNILKTPFGNMKKGNLHFLFKEEDLRHDTIIPDHIKKTRCNTTLRPYNTPFRFLFETNKIHFYITKNIRVTKSITDIQKFTLTEIQNTLLEDGPYLLSKARNITEHDKIALIHDIQKGIDLSPDFVKDMQDEYHRAVFLNKHYAILHKKAITSIRKTMESVLKESI